MPEASPLTDDEEHILKYLQNGGSAPQSEIWKDLDIPSGKVSRVVRSLVEKNIVEREEITHKGSRTYRVKVVKEQEEDEHKSLNTDLLMAGDKLSPFVDNDEIDGHSEEFDAWLQRLVEEYEREN